MFIHFLCLCPLRLAIMLNHNISKVARTSLLVVVGILPYKRYKSSQIVGKT